MTALAPLQSGLLAAVPGVRHGFFSRQGGVSKGIYKGLNVGRGSNSGHARALGSRNFGIDIGNDQFDSATIVAL